MVKACIYSYSLKTSCYTYFWPFERLKKEPLMRFYRVQVDSDFPWVNASFCSNFVGRLDMAAPKTGSLSFLIESTHSLPSWLELCVPETISLDFLVRVDQSHGRADSNSAPPKSSFCFLWAGWLDLFIDRLEPCAKTKYVPKSTLFFLESSWHFSLKHIKISTH